MSLLHDSQAHINSHIKDNKELFRVDKIWPCKHCKSENSAMLSNVWVRKDRLTYFFNCELCGHNFQASTDEKTLYKQMINADYTDSLETQFFDMFQVCDAFSFYSDLESERSGSAMILRLLKKHRFWQLWYKIRYWGNGGNDK